MRSDDFELDELIPVEQALSGLSVRGGRPISQATRFRWMASGLRTVCLGATRLTTRRWIEEFIEERTRRRALPLTRRKPRVGDEPTPRLERAGA